MYIPDDDVRCRSPRDIDAVGDDEDEVVGVDLNVADGDNDGNIDEVAHNDTKEACATSVF